MTGQRRAQRRTQRRTPKRRWGQAWGDWWFERPMVREITADLITGGLLIAMMIGIGHIIGTR